MKISNSALTPYSVRDDQDYFYIHLGEHITLPDGTTGTFFKNTSKRNENMTDPKDIVSLDHSIGASALMAKGVASHKFNATCVKYRLGLKGSEDMIINDNLIIWPTGKSVFDSTVVSIITPGDSVVIQTATDSERPVSIEIRGEVIATYRDTNGSTLVIFVKWEGNLRYSGALGDGFFGVL